MSTGYRVHLYFDGPHMTAEAAIKVPDADDEADAVREAIVALGFPKVGKVEKLSEGF